jgi:hypothetical protein
MNSNQLLEMSRPLVHKFRRISQKLSIKILKSLNPTEKLPFDITSSEKDAALLFKKMLMKHDSELLISPISGKYFLKNDHKEILIILTDYEIIVINHVFGYTIKISQKTQRALYQAFINEVEQRRLEMEMAFRKNVKHSLQSIISHIND